MTDIFLSKLGIDIVSPTPSRYRSNHERLMFLLIGSPTGIRKMIGHIHQCDLAEAGAWSRLMPAPDPGEMMSIMVLYQRRD